MNNTEKKNKAIQILKELDIFQPYINEYKATNTVTMFENFAGFYVDKNSDIYKKIQEIEKEYKSKVYAVTHNFTEFGELHTFLIVTNYKEEWNTLVENYSNPHTFIAFAYVWNKDDDMCSEFGSVTVQSHFGGLRRIA